ncbi:bacterial regulatory s, tetR family protein [Mycolicibacterium hassiacum DSM 44199]|jgi:AcrR family transcriptional regulator|uniref:Bacterial regulatory s, tetR family protein n=1 Tax=Mycolicibacterium hassiacum (strain DSM 44199 / CIP 105218 / JCM 12690 / 3849) TaxID=1122247 RepID=K5B8Y8_MYCHD|nr:TetR/AcrR family transcriptional regulator [Mycolicibacterium hassiacum]EKF24523.1 bacterial regulatory s, tetR family protein [Mycolicibacterium hassiacum DSM 44199]MBX5488881.1 TetR/AcrR family transcriptional regulator [Mycolicibacterium hassiacum]MDA4084355.1 TetR family transcriptional regulator [Mycolicibacterium hassiacum DSM 44199]PZN18617.1 MAG: TetR/AcrR family transcriptional regulator [Mycolicibacterium hassiacum]VCT88965.1 putative HTH-type transcriptional regulator [Mycoliciba
MARRHGWAGNTPASDEEAINRILDAADEIIAERGSAMRLSDVARALGVTRQTVYRYFPGTEALLIATVMRSGDGFLDQLARHVAGETDPVAAVVEGLAFTIENLSTDDRIIYILSRRSRGELAPSLASETALAFSRSMLHRYQVDWQAYGFDEAALGELSEFLLRILYSYLADTNQPNRTGAQLRAFLARWVGPAVMYPRIAAAVESVERVTDAATPGRVRRRSAS